MAKLTSFPVLGSPVTKKNVIAALQRGGVSNVTRATDGSSTANAVNSVIDALTSLGLVTDAWTPASLFTTEAGAWWDPSDLSSMWQDSAGTIAAAVNAPVGKIKDKSGHGNDLVQATSSLQPILRSDGTHYWIEADGVDDRLAGTLIANMPQPATLGMAYRFNSTSGSPDIFDTGNGQSGTAGASTRHQLGIRSGLVELYGGVTLVNGPAADLVDHAVLAVYNDPNNTLQIDAGTPVTGSSGTAYPLAGQSINVFNAANLSIPEAMSGRWYGGVYIDRLLTTDETNSLRTWLGSKAGLTL